MNGIVVGVDRSDASREGLRWAVDEAVRRGASLTAVHVIPAVPNQAFVVYPRSRGVSPDQIDEARGAIALMVAEEVRRAGAPLLAVQVRVLVGDAVSELVHVSADAELLVLTAHDGPLHRLVLGSVCRAVLGSATCPVVVVPRARTRGRSAAHEDVGMTEAGAPAP